MADYDKIMNRLMDVHNGFSELQSHPELRDFLIQAFEVAVIDNDNLLNLAKLHLSKTEYNRLIKLLTGTKNERYAALWQTMKLKGLVYNIMFDTITTHHKGLSNINQYGGGDDNSGDIRSNNRRQVINNVTNNKSSKNCIIL